MSGPGALVLTGIAFAVLALALTYYATEARSADVRHRNLAWAAFVCALSCEVAAAWWEALR